VPDEPHELRTRPKDCSEDTSDDYTINVEVWRDSLWLSIQGGVETTRSHPLQRSETCSRNLHRVQNRKRIIRSTLTKMRDEDTMKTGIRILTNKNPPTRSQMINRNSYEDYAITKTLLHTSGKIPRTNGHRWKKSRENSTMGKVWISLSVK
jgi:hypothetical protein